MFFAISTISIFYSVPYWCKTTQQFWDFIPNCVWQSHVIYSGSSGFLTFSFLSTEWHTLERKRTESTFLFIPQVINNHSWCPGYKNCRCNVLKLVQNPSLLFPKLMSPSMNEYFFYLLQFTDSETIYIRVQTFALGLLATDKNITFLDNFVLSYLGVFSCLQQFMDHKL